MPYMECGVARAEKQYHKRAALEIDHEAEFFRVACSCPPDKRLHMRGGVMYDHPASSGMAWYVDAEVIDFDDPQKMSGWGFVWTNANWYQSYPLILSQGGMTGATSFYLIGDIVEFETAAEAEQNIIDIANDVSDLSTYVWGQNYPLCGVVFRNDGNIGPGNYFLPIDPINRQRSYIWPQDLRPRNIAL